MKYKIWDGQLSEYAFQNVVFDNKSDAVEELINFFSNDCHGDLTQIRASLWSDGEFMELYIEGVKE